MGWGRELWDKQDRVEQFTENGLMAVEQARQLYTQLAAVELQYSQNIKKVVKSFPRVTDGSTFAQVWNSVLNCFEKVADDHDSLATYLANDVSNELRNTMRQKQAERAEILKRIQKLQAELAAAADVFDKERKRHEKVFREADAARVAYEKTERSDSTARVKIEKARKLWAEKAKANDQSEHALRQAYDEYNSARRVHYYSSMPAEFDALQAMHENRAEALVQTVFQVSTTLKRTLDVTLSHYRPVDDAVRGHNKTGDSAAFCNAIKSNEPLPKDVAVVLPTSTETSGPNSPKVAAKHQHREREKERDQPPEEDEREPPRAQPAAAPVSRPPQCRVLYEFPGTNPGELPAAENEIVNLIQNDGSGWVLAEKLYNRQQGYLPESYLQIVQDDA